MCMLFATGMRQQEQHNSSQRLTDACRSVVDCYRNINADTTTDMFPFLFFVYYNFDATTTSVSVAD